MDFLLELLVALLILIGAFFVFVGSFGLVRLPDLITRLHSATKATTLGVGSLLIASMLYFLLFQDRLSFHELTITIFLFLAAPVTAYVIAKAYILRNLGSPATLPPSVPAESGWANFSKPKGQDEA
jgi:multicomponent K+:H+ antiporter subunit G